MTGIGNRRKKRAEDKITILLVPGRTAPVRTLSFPRGLVGGVVALVMALMAVFAWTSYSLWAAREDIRNVNRIKADCREKSKQIDDMGRALRELESQKAAITREQQEIKRLMGISTKVLRSESSSRGYSREGSRTYDSESAPDMESAMKQLQAYLSTRQAELALLKAKVSENRSYYLSLPNNWPVAGRITSQYGWRNSPFGRHREYHEGIDIAADTGTPVAAAGAGVVIYTGRDRVYGRLIKIDHGDGYMTWYGHNREILVREGQVVQKGQIIAKVGSSGRSSGPHLHFTLQKDGACRDPLSYLPSIGG